MLNDNGIGRVFVSNLYQITDKRVFVSGSFYKNEKLIIANFMENNRDEHRDKMAEDYIIGVWVLKDNVDKDIPILPANSPNVVAVPPINSLMGARLVFENLILMGEDGCRRQDSILVLM